MDQALVDRERVDERFQRRTRRSFRHYAVYLTVDLLIPVIGRSDPRPHGHVARIDENRRRIVNASRLVLLQVSLNLTFDEPLKVGIDGRIDPAGGTGTAGEKRVYEVWGAARHRITRSHDDRKIELTAIGNRIPLAPQPDLAQLRPRREQVRMRGRPARALRRTLWNDR